MIAAVVIVIWIVMVLMALIIGISREKAQVEEQRDIREQSLKAFALQNRKLEVELRNSQDQFARLIQYVHEIDDDDNIKSFDEVLRSLHLSPRGRDYAAIIEGKRAFQVAMDLSVHPISPDDCIYKELVFHKRLIVWNGQKVVCWEREGWIFMPAREL